MKKLAIGILLLSAAGCASINVTPPADPSFDRSKSYQLPFEKVWIRAVDWFADHNVTIEKIEKTSGLLTAKYLMKSDDKYLDCGDIKVSGMLGAPIIEKYGSLNVTVRNVTDNEAKINVNFFGEYRLEGRDFWDGHLIKASGRCVSTGTLEKDILSYIER